MNRFGKEVKFDSVLEQNGNWVMGVHWPKSLEKLSSKIWLGGAIRGDSDDAATIEAECVSLKDTLSMSTMPLGIRKCSLMVWIMEFVSPPNNKRGLNFTSK